MKSVNDDGTPLKVVQKLLTSTVGERDFSAQEICHLLLMLPMVRASRDFVILSLDGSWQGDEDKPVTVESQLDQYCARPVTDDFAKLTLSEFVQKYKLPKKKGDALIPRKKDVVIIARPYCSPDPPGPHYEQYCRDMEGNVSTHSRNLLLESDTSYWMRCQWWAGNCWVKWIEDCVKHFLTSK